MRATVRAELGAALGASVAQVRALSGGDINDAWRVTLSDGRAVFVKTHDGAEADMFPLEAEGLAWLAEANAIRTPRVLAASASYLALELIEPGRRTPDFAERLGRELAALHRFGAEPLRAREARASQRFGWREDNFIASLRQDNTCEEDWPSFYARRRLEPMLRRASERGLASAAMTKGFDRLFAKIEELAGPAEPPSRLHGDLWGGNCHVGEDGAPVLIDPAVYGGHREMDLAMMQLFGGFAQRTFDAYHEAWPLAPGWRERTPPYQLYPLLVHVVLFGGSYVGAVERALDACV